MHDNDSHGIKVYRNTRKENFLQNIQIFCPIDFHVKFNEVRNLQNIHVCSHIREVLQEVCSKNKLKQILPEHSVCQVGSHQLKPGNNTLIIYLQTHDTLAEWY